MKRTAVIIFIALACVGAVWAGYQAAAPSKPLTKYFPAGSLLYLEAGDFSSLLSDWNSSPQKRAWIESSNYDVFSRSRLFLRLKGAGDQFNAAAGLPPDMDFLTQVAGGRSALAIYDIGNLEFLYITYLPSAKSMETTLWQSRSKFEPRNAGGVDFYFRRDPESKREVAFAVSGDYLLLATREDLLAAALELRSAKPGGSAPGRTIEDEAWFAQSTASAGRAGDLRMVLNLTALVPNGYFRTYWVQQNITDLSQYSAAVCDLYRSSKQYREERVLIRKQESEERGSADGFSAAADLVRLVPDDAGAYTATANPDADSAFALLETKLLVPHLGPAPPSQIAPQVALTSGEQGDSSDLETRIDQAPVERAATSQPVSALKQMLDKTPLLASLRVQSTARDQAGVFVRIHSAVVLEAASDWNQADAQAALTEFIRPGLTASQFGTSWQAGNGYQQLDGLWPLAVATRGKYFVVSDDSALMESLLANFNRKPTHEPAALLAGFNHQRERVNFARFTGFIDHPNLPAYSVNGSGGEPPLFSANLAGLSTTLAAVASEKIDVREDGGKVRQSVIYEWSQ